MSQNANAGADFVRPGTGLFVILPVCQLADPAAAGGGLHCDRPPDIKGGNLMQIVVVKAPAVLGGLLKKLFRIH